MAVITEDTKRIAHMMGLPANILWDINVIHEQGREDLADRARDGEITIDEAFAIMRSDMKVEGISDLFGSLSPEEQVEFVKFLWLNHRFSLDNVRRQLRFK